MAEVRGQIAGADEDAVDTFDGGYGLDLLERGFGFDLHEDAGIEMRIAVIVLDAAVVVGARHDGHAANAERRIARSGDGLARLIGILHEGNEQGARAHVERPLDDDRLVPGHAEDRLGRAAAHGLQLRQQRVDVVGRVLAVDHDPIKARAGQNLSSNGAGQSGPAPDWRSPFASACLNALRGKSLATRALVSISCDGRARA